MRPRALVLRTAGTNCDHELAHAFELAGACARRIHLNRLIEAPDLFGQFELIGIPGGFSYGDDIAAGRIFAARLRHRLLDRWIAAVERGVPIIGICNGFQVLVKMGLLPEPGLQRQTATLADNDTGRFVARWVQLEVPIATVCIWTRRLGSFPLPIAHGQGRFVTETPETLNRWAEAGQIAIRYRPGDDPNGSVGHVAGLCDPTGLVLGLMPHPERFVDRTQHPAWTADTQGLADPAGLQMLRNAVAQVSG